MYPYGRTFLWLPILQNQGRETSVFGRSPNLPEVLYILSMLAESGVHRVMAEWSPAGLFPSANLTLYNCTPAPTPRTVGHSWRPQEKTCIQAFMCTATGLPEWHLAGHPDPDLLVVCASCWSREPLVFWDILGRFLRLWCSSEAQWLWDNSEPLSLWANF